MTYSPSKHCIMDGNEDIVVLAKTKLAERPVVWKEAYTKRALFLKKQFHEVLGPGSYFRFEGHDTESDDEYFVVVGPAGIHSPKREFFAGVRKLPADYAAGGLYFHDIKEAMNYASATWGIVQPKEMRYYDSDDLKDLSKKIDDWKEEHKDDEQGEEYLQEWLESIKKGEEETIMSDQAEPQSYFYEQSSTYPFFIKIAMPSWLRNEVGFTWWDMDEVLAGSAEGFDEAASTQPSLNAAKDFAFDEMIKRKKTIAKNYGPEYVGSNFYKMYLVHRPDRGTYIVAVSPYCGTAFEQAKDKFGVFRWKLNLASNEEIDKKVTELLNEYAEKFGITLTRDDLVIPVDKKPMVGEISIGPSGREKIYGSPEWKAQVLERYGVQPGRGMVAELRRRYRDQKAIHDQIEKEYAARGITGQAFLDEIPPPPTIGLEKRQYGQQIPSTIYRQNVANESMSKIEKIEKFGFDSIQEAVDHLRATEMPGAPIGNIPNTTSEDLHNARVKRQQDVAAGRVSPEQETIRKQVKEPMAEPIAKPEQVVAPTDLPEEKIPYETPDYELALAEPFEVDASLKGMIKMAADLASIGKIKEAEGIHKILRKHIAVTSDETLKKQAEGDWPEHLKEGRFTTYCKKNGFKGPCKACAEKAMKSDDASVRGMASFYMNTVKP